MGGESGGLPLAGGSSTLGKAESSEIPTSFFSSRDVIMSGVELNAGVLSGFYLTSALSQELSCDEQEDTNSQREASILSSFSAIAS